MSQRRCVLLAECLLLQCKENVHAAGESVSLFADTTRRLLIMAQCNLLQAARGALACCQTYCQDFVPKQFAVIVLVV